MKIFNFLFLVLLLNSSSVYAARPNINGNLDEVNSSYHNMTNGTVKKFRNKGRLTGNMSGGIINEFSGYINKFSKGKIRKTFIPAAITEMKGGKIIENEYITINSVENGYIKNMKGIIGYFNSGLIDNLDGSIYMMNGGLVKDIDKNGSIQNVNAGDILGDIRGSNSLNNVPFIYVATDGYLNLCSKRPTKIYNRVIITDGRLYVHNCNFWGMGNVILETNGQLIFAYNNIILPDLTIGALYTSYSDLIDNGIPVENSEGKSQIYFNHNKKEAIYLKAAIKKFIPFNNTTFNFNVNYSTGDSDFLKIMKFENQVKKFYYRGRPMVSQFRSSIQDISSHVSLWDTNSKYHKITNSHKIAISSVAGTPGRHAQRINLIQDDSGLLEFNILGDAEYISLGKRYYTLEKDASNIWYLNLIED